MSRSCSGRQQPRGKLGRRALFPESERRQLGPTGSTTCFSAPAFFPASGAAHAVRHVLLGDDVSLPPSNFAAYLCSCTVSAVGQELEARGSALLKGAHRAEVVAGRQEQRAVLLRISCRESQPQNLRPRLQFVYSTRIPPRPGDDQLLSVRVEEGLGQVVRLDAGLDLLTRPRRQPGAHC